MQLSTKHLLGIRDLQTKDIQLILDTAKQFKEVLQRPIKKVPSLRDVTIVNLFYENSTRTRISFELAEKRLSADTINFSASGSSVSNWNGFTNSVSNLQPIYISTSTPSYLKFYNNQFLDGGIKTFNITSTGFSVICLVKFVSNNINNDRIFDFGSIQLYRTSNNVIIFIVNGSAISSSII